MSCRLKNHLVLFTFNLYQLQKLKSDFFLFLCISFYVYVLRNLLFEDISDIKLIISLLQFLPNRFLLRSRATGNWNFVPNFRMHFIVLPPPGISRLRNHFHQYVPFYDRKLRRYLGHFGHDIGLTFGRYH